MSDLVTKLRKAFRTFPIIEDSPVDLFNDAAKRIEALETDKESAVKLVLAAGLSTGHADSCAELVEEVLGQAEEFRATIKRIEALPDKIIEVERVEHFHATPRSVAKGAANMIREALKQHTEPPAQKATLILGHPDGGPRDG